MLFNQLPLTSQLCQSIPMASELIDMYVKFWVALRNAKYFHSSQARADLEGPFVDTAGAGNL
jgi:hypothetical protein